MLCTNKSEAYSIKKQQRKSIESDCTFLEPIFVASIIKKIKVLTENNRFAK